MILETANPQKYMQLSFCYEFSKKSKYIYYKKKSIFLIFKSSNIIDLFKKSDEINRKNNNQGNIAHINSNN